MGNFINGNHLLPGNITFHEHKSREPTLCTSVPQTMEQLLGRDADELVFDNAMHC